MNNLLINGRSVGPGKPVYLVAELSANHHQNFDEAVKLIAAAKKSGADAVKLQTYTPDTMTIKSSSQCFQVKGGTLWDNQYLYDLYQEAYTPWQWQPKLKEIAEELGLACFSTPFDISAVDFLERIGVPAYKVASFELVDLPLIEYIARTGKPMIMSTGMATADEIEEAVAAARSAGASQIALLKCTSAYPAPPESLNLRAMQEFQRRWDVVVGLSDHTVSVTAAVAAVALGACIIEKHFTLSRSVPGPDSAFSLEPQEFEEMSQAVRFTEKALGSAYLQPSGDENAMRALRRSLFVVQDMQMGELFTEKNVRSIRPGYGLPPKRLKDVLGKHAATDIKQGTPLSEEMIKEFS